MSEIVEIENVARIEGHASVAIYLDDTGKLLKTEYIATEPSRAFDVILRGKHASEIPRLAPRICGICYAPHNICACKALENAWGTEVPEAAKKTRELINYANTLSSHALHTIFLAGPGLLLEGINTITDLKRKHPDFIDAGVKLRAVGQDISEIIAGRRVHTTVAIPGGVRSALEKEKLEKISKLLSGTDEPMEVIRRYMHKILSSKKEYMNDFGRIETHFVSIKQGKRFEIYDGAVELLTKDQKSRLFSAAEFLASITEEEKEYSYVRHPYVKQFGPEEGQFRVGPLARIQKGVWKNQSYDDFKQHFGSAPQSSMAYDAARVAEMFECIKEMHAILDDGLDGEIKNVAVPKAGVGTAVIEAPRGLLLHQYETDAKGIVKRARVIAPTTFHQGSIERATHAATSEVIKNKTTHFSEEDKIRVEQVIRAYDPCMSCAGATQLRIIKRPQVRAHH